MQLHRLLCEQFPEHSLSRNSFSKIVSETCKIYFGSVRSDICEKCEELHVSLAAVNRENEVSVVEDLEREKESHLSQAQLFYVDFEKNLPLPITNVGREYYKRQLYVRNFGIINVQTGETSIYLYSEHFGTKDPNEIISMLS